MDDEVKIMPAKQENKMGIKTELLRMLRETDGYVSGQALCDSFGVSRTAIWKHINSLKEAGYEIESVPNKGYRLMSAPDLIADYEIRSQRNSVWAGREIICYKETDSTNIRVKELIESGHPSGTLAVAERQSAGRGRRGRGWDSPPGCGIFMSLALKPDMNPNNASMLTLVAALAVADAVNEVCGTKVGIKWPNDLVINGKKICGILTEMSAQFDYINNIVIGIGINVNDREFPEEIAATATTLEQECGRSFHRSSIIAKFLEYFEKYFEIFMKTEDLSALVKTYDAMLVNRGRQVKVLDPRTPFEGRAMGITKRGELIVDTWESRKLVSSGEVSVRGIYGYV